MEKFFNQSKELAQKPTGDSGFFSEHESVLTDEEKRETLLKKLEEAQSNLNKSNAEINNLLGDYKNNFADKMADEQKLIALSASLEEAESALKTLRYQIDYINKGKESLYNSLDEQAIKN